MYYCFVEEDLKGLSCKDPLVIQAQYAKALNKYGCCSLSERRISVPDRQNVFLRAACDNMYEAMDLLLNNGYSLIEGRTEIAKIGRWERLKLAKRPIYAVKYRDILNDTAVDELRLFLQNTPSIFLKSRRKGFSAELPAEKLVQKDPEFLQFLKLHCQEESGELLISEKLKVCSDSLGSKEARHLVMNGRIANSSRPLHSVKHAVPKSLMEIGEELAARISCVEGFPSNYVLDVAEFERDGEKFCDIVELNPVTCSMCYVNNSIFDEMLPEVAGWYGKTHMGLEYCYDALKDPESYLLRRFSQTTYNYQGEGRYSF